jgi:hypothetical protein
VLLEIGRVEVRAEVGTQKFEYQVDSVKRYQNKIANQKKPW